MVTLASQATQRSILDSPPGELAFRIRGTSRNGQVIKVAAPKCTVGSGARCTLRLRAVGVRSIHCLLMRGSTGIVARCWSGDTLHNGRQFQDAMLSPGDILSIGPLQLELIADNQGRRDDRTLKPLWATSNPQLSETFIALRSRMLSARQQARRRVRHLVTEIRDLQRQIAELEQVDGSHGEQGRLLQAQTRALAVAQEELKESRTAWEARLGERQSALADREQTLEARQNSIDSQHQGWRDEHELTQARLDQAQVSLAIEQQELAHRRQTLDADRSAWLAESSVLRGQLDQERQSLASERTQLECERQALTQDRSKMERELNEKQRLLDEQHRQLENKIAQQKSAQHESWLDGQQRAAELARRETALAAKLEEHGRLESQQREELVTLESRRLELDERWLQLEVEREAWQAQGGTISSEWDLREAELNTRVADLDGQIAVLVEQAKGDKARWAVAEEALTEARAQLETERKAWRAELESKDAHYAARQAELTARIEDLAGERQLLLDQSREDMEQLATADEALAQVRLQLKAERESQKDNRKKQDAEWVARHAELNAQIEALDRERAAFIEQTRADQARVDAVEQSLAQARTEFEAERAAWRTERDNSDAHWSATNRQLNARIDDLDRERRTLVDRRRTSEERSTGAEQALAEARTQFEAEREAWLADYEKNDSQWTQRHAELTARLEGLERERQEILDDASENKAGWVAAEGALADVRAQFESERTTLIAEREALVAEREQIDQARRAAGEQAARFATSEAQWKHDRAEWENERRELLAQIEKNNERNQAQIEAEESGLAHARQQLERDRQAAQVEQAQKTLEIEERSASLEAGRAALENERQLWQTERADRETELSTRAEVLEQLSAVLVAREKALAASSEQAERRSSAELDDCDGRLAERETKLEAAHQAAQAELEQLRGQLALEQQKLTDRQAALERQQAESLAKLEERTIELNALAAELTAKQRLVENQTASSQGSDMNPLEDIQREAWQKEHSQRDAAHEEMIAMLTAQVDELRQQLSRTQDVAVRPADPQNDVATENEADERSTTAKAEEASDVKQHSSEPEDAFARLRGLSLLKEETQGATTAEAAPKAEEERAPQRPTTPVAPAPAEGGEEESIEQYMACLLNRVRTGSEPSAGGDSQDSARSRARGGRTTSSGATEEAEIAAPVRPLPEPPQPKPTKTEPVEFLPRPAPPETSELGRMRELANLQARAAITKHGRKRWALDALLKWTIAAFVISASVGGMSFASASDNLTRGIALGGFAVASYWVWQALRASKPGFEVIGQKFRRKERYHVSSAPLDDPARETTES